MSSAVGADGLLDPVTTASQPRMNLDALGASRFERYAHGFAGTIGGGTSDIQRNAIAQRLLRLRQS